MEGLVRELESVVVQLSACEGLLPAPAVNDKVDDLRFDARRLTRRFKLLGQQPDPWIPGPASEDFPTLLCWAVGPAGRECKRRQCFLKLDLGRVRGLHAVAFQTTDVVLSLIEDALHHRATWIEVSAEPSEQGFEICVRTDADLTPQSLGVLVIANLTLTLGPALTLDKVALESGSLTVRLGAQAVRVNGHRASASEEKEPTWTADSPTGT